MKTKKRGFSKNLLIADYAVTVILIVAFFIFASLNGLYTIDATNKLIEMGMDSSMITITPPFNLDGFGVFFSAWIGQLAVSSYAFYAMTKSEHKIELPIQLLENLPDDVKDRVEMTEIITTVLTNTNN